MKLFPCNHRIKFMKSLLYCRDPSKAGENFIPAKRDHPLTLLKNGNILNKRIKSCWHLIEFFSNADKELKIEKDDNLFTDIIEETGPVIEAIKKYKVFCK